MPPVETTEVGRHSRRLSTLALAMCNIERVGLRLALSSLLIGSRSSNLMCCPPCRNKQSWQRLRSTWSAPRASNTRLPAPQAGHQRQVIAERANLGVEGARIDQAARVRFVQHWNALKHVDILELSESFVRACAGADSATARTTIDARSGDHDRVAVTRSALTDPSPTIE